MSLHLFIPSAQHCAFIVPMGITLGPSQDINSSELVLCLAQNQLQ